MLRPIDFLNTWFDRDISHPLRCEVETVVDQPTVAEIRFATRYFSYTVTADLMHGESFLGCTCFDRKQRTTRYLPEGPVCDQTWQEIVDAINESEMICKRPLPGHLF